MQVRFEVTHDYGFTPEELSKQLAEALQTSVNCQRDILVYQEQIRTERRKIMDDEFLVQQIKQFRANPPAKISRMEPMMQYDLDDLEKEIDLAKARISEWEDFISNAEQTNKDAQKESIRLQKEIAELRKAKK